MRPNLHREPLKLSTIPAHHVWLAEGERRQIVCPDCQTRHPLRRGMIWPHHTDRRIKCEGSARRVEIDIDLTTWAEEVTAADATVTGRRATKVTRKPKTPPLPPVSRMHRIEQTADEARQSYHRHREHCATCRKAGRTAARQLCTYGMRLANTYAERLQEPSRKRARTECQEATASQRRSAAAWGKQTGLAREELTKRSGTAIEERNNLARSIVGTTAERGRPVPR